MILSTEQVTTIRKILKDSRNIAVVGLSPKPHRPVNPGQDTILGLNCYPNLRAIPTPVDMVDIFRRPEAVLPIVADAIDIGAKFIWMQEGIVNEDAARKAKEAGLDVIMDRCTKIDHLNLL